MKPRVGPDACTPVQSCHSQSIVASSPDLLSASASAGLTSPMRSPQAPTWRWKGAASIGGGGCPPHISPKTQGRCWRSDHVNHRNPTPRVSQLLDSARGLEGPRIDRAQSVGTAGMQEGSRLAARCRLRSAAVPLASSMLGWLNRASFPNPLLQLVSVLNMNPSRTAATA